MFTLSLSLVKRQVQQERQNGLWEAALIHLVPSTLEGAGRRWWAEEGDGEEGGEEDLSLSLSLSISLSLSLSLSLYRIRMKHEIGSFHTGRGGEGGGGLRRLAERRAGVIPEAAGGLLETFQRLQEASWNIPSLSFSLSLPLSFIVSFYLSLGS